MKHLKYLRYVVRHKWFVFVACLRYGLIWQGIKHDWSKFLPCEWMPYAEFFYGKHSFKRGGNARPPEAIDTAFDLAWLHHQHFNPHHWQHWVRHGDDGTVRVFKMPMRYAKEMIADWRGAGRAITGRIGCRDWYEANKNKMMLHPETRSFVEFELSKEPRP